MRNEALDLIREKDKIDTGSLAALLDVDRQKLFEILNAEAKSGTIVRQGVFVENGSPRPTLCFGWSCPVH